MNFVASVKMTFHDAITGGMEKVRKSFDATKNSFSKAFGPDPMQTATQLSLMAASTDKYRENLQTALNVPSEVAAGLESALASASTVITPELSIDGSFEKTMEVIKQRSLDWASGVADNATLASASASDFASTTYSMLSAGLKAEAAMNATAQAMVLAKGTMGDSSEAANLLAIAYNTMGDKSIDSATELQHLSDVVAKTQAAFQIANLGQLNEGLKYGIPVAQKYGIAWEELSTIVGQLNSSGLTGSMAGTSFSSMMAQMMKASNQLGFSIAYDETGAMSVIDTLKNIRSEFGEMKDFSPEVQMAFDTAFGQEGSRALTLLMTSLDSLDSQLLAVTNSQGQTALMAERMSNSYQESVNKMNNARQSMMARLGESTNKTRGFFNDIKTSFFVAVSKILDTPAGDSLAAIAGNAMIAADSFLGFSGTALNVGAQLATIVAMSSQAGGAMALLKSSMTLLATPFTAVGKLIKTIVVAMGKWIVSAFTAAVANWAVVGPILAIIAAVAALAAGAYLVIKHWESIKEFFSGLWEGIKETFSAALDWISEKALAFVDFITAPFKKLGETISGAFEWLGDDDRWYVKAWNKVTGKDKDKGKDPLKSSAEGMKTSNALTEATENKMAEAGAYLPHSDADKGAFSTLTQSGAAIPATMAEGLKLDTTLSSTTNELFSSVTKGVVLDFPTQNYDFSEAKFSDGENGFSVLTAISEKLDRILEKTGKRESTVHIEAINLPDVNDIDAVVKFVTDLRDKIEREPT